MDYSNFIFTKDNDPRIKNIIKSDLEYLCNKISRYEEVLQIILWGSLSFGEGRYNKENLISDYDIYIVLKNSRQTKKLLDYCKSLEKSIHTKATFKVILYPLLYLHRKIEGKVIFSKIKQRNSKTLVSTYQNSAL